MNLAIPGTGSLVAGRVSGYPQLGIAVLALLASVIFGVRFVLWWFANWSRIYGSQGDPYVVMSDLWHAVRWALLGMAVFLIDWLWSLGSSLGILAESKDVKQ